MENLKKLAEYIKFVDYMFSIIEEDKVK